MSDRSYDLIARLGRGGMGVVDLARDEEGNKVALKRLTLHGSAAEIARARERLLREAAVLRKLHHPNVVGLLDVVDEGDEIVLVMPYLSGGSLAERVAQHGPAPADEVERQARRLLGALASAHATGIVHRDIKPANILFDERGEPCLADFGVALSRDQTHGLTVAGMVVGTPGFMAPEQARGEPVSPATDVFSLGATLLFAATGEGPYGQGDPGLLMVRAAGGQTDKIPKALPSSLRRLLRTMLDPRPDRRPTAAALAGAVPGGTAP
ncbi:MAG TPA: serine/threonine-protein kinase, partial [Acidimicrobiales bacterium]|nr:serine/threonine-protein kinase [Acidimicrobiales bacterium]